LVVAPAYRLIGFDVSKVFVELCKVAPSWVVFMANTMTAALPTNHAQPLYFAPSKPN
jgi:hypothetical protein